MHSEIAQDRASTNPRIEIDAGIYDPSSPEFFRDPVPIWRRLLSEFPVAWHRNLKFWVVSSHELACEILKHPSLPVKHPSLSGKTARGGDSAANIQPGKQTEFDLVGRHSLFRLDSADHARVRKLALVAFSRTAMGKVEEKSRDLIVELFDGIGRVKEFDVYSEISSKLPVLSLVPMLGIPKDAETVWKHDLADNCLVAMSPLVSPDERERAKERTGPGFAMLQMLIDERRRAAEPGDDFLGMLIGTVDERGERLNDMQIKSLITALIVAGVDPIVDFYTCAIWKLLTHPDQYQLLLDEPGLMENAFHEIIRHSASGKVIFAPRHAVEDLEIGGQRILKEEVVTVSAAAHYDPKKWPEPDRFDITRRPVGSLIFGAGAHYCLGAAFAKLQGSLMIREFNRRFPRARLQGDISYDYGHPMVRRINKLRVATGLDGSC